MQDMNQGSKSIDQVICAFKSETRARVIREKHNGTTSEEESHSTPTRIFEVAFSSWTSRMVLTAAELQLFTILERKAGKQWTSADISRVLGVNKTSIVEFLDTLVSCDMLKCSKGADGHTFFSNTAECALYMDKNMPESYVGSLTEYLSQAFYISCSNLIDSLHTGRPQSIQQCMPPGMNLYDAMYSHPDLMESYAHAMLGFTHEASNEIDKACKIKKAKTLMDIGGGTGQLAAHFARTNPDLQCVVTERPELVPMTRQTIKSLWPDARKQIKVVAHNYLTDKFPHTDVVTMSLILSDCNDITRQILIKKAYKALPKMGALIVVGTITDDLRCENAFALSYSWLQLVWHMEPIASVDRIPFESGLSRQVSVKYFRFNYRDSR
jgi:ubiquinone/menaquinone biosynthesis C-methylase UbiE